MPYPLSLDLPKDYLKGNPYIGMVSLKYCSVRTSRCARDLPLSLQWTLILQPKSSSELVVILINFECRPEMVNMLSTCFGSAARHQPLKQECGAKVAAKQFKSFEKYASEPRKCCWYLLRAAGQLQFIHLQT